MPKIIIRVMKLALLMLFHHPEKVGEVSLAPFQYLWRSLHAKRKPIFLSKKSHNMPKIMIRAMELVLTDVDLSP